MLKKILLGLVALIAATLAYAALQPATYRVERSATIAATPAVLFDYFNNHKKFNEWNPWAKMDPEAKNTYSGPEAGVGAIAEWDGSKVGKGRATITESRPGEFIRQRLDCPNGGRQHRRVHLQARGRQDQSHLGHVRREQLPGQNHEPVHGLRSHVRT
jgi:hypothetical protein